MIINVKVFTKAKRNFIKETKSGFKAYVTAAPEKGRANVALIELLSKHFNIKKYHINIISGQHLRNKVIEIPGNKHSAS